MSNMASREEALLLGRLSQAVSCAQSMQVLRKSVTVMLQERSDRTVVWTHLIDGQVVFNIWPDGQAAAETVYCVEAPKQYLTSQGW